MPPPAFLEPGHVLPQIFVGASRCNIIPSANSGAWKETVPVLLLAPAARPRADAAAWAPLQAAVQLRSATARSGRHMGGKRQRSGAARTLGGYYYYTVSLKINVVLNYMSQAIFGFVCNLIGRASGICCKVM